MLDYNTMCLVYDNIKGALVTRGLSRMQAIEHECFADRGAAVCLLLAGKILDTHASATGENLAKF